MDPALHEQLKQARRRVARLESDLKDAHEDLTELEARAAAPAPPARKGAEGFADE